MNQRPNLPPHRPRPAGAVSALEGLRVIDFGQFVTGPYCTQILGDEVVSYLWSNRNKRSVALGAEAGGRPGRAP